MLFIQGRTPLFMQFIQGRMPLFMLFIQDRTYLFMLFIQGRTPLFMLFIQGRTLPCLCCSFQGELLTIYVIHYWITNSSLLILFIPGRAFLFHKEIIFLFVMSSLFIMIFIFFQMLYFLLVEVLFCGFVLLCCFDYVFTFCQYVVLLFFILFTHCIQYMFVLFCNQLQLSAYLFGFGILCQLDFLLVSLCTLVVCSQVFSLFVLLVDTIHLICVYLHLISLP